MATYDFRILIETKKGKQFSYISQSFYNSAVDTNYAVSASDVWHRITGSLSCSYQNSFLFSGSNPGTNFNQSYILKNNPYISASLKSGNESGSIQFHTNGVTGSDGDKLRKFKFIGEKVCTSLGIPHNLWQFTDEFRLVSGSEKHYFRGDVVADSLHVVNNMAISNLGTMDSDLPFKVDKQSDRFIKWQLSSASVAPNNDLLIGYNDTLDQYWISASDNVTFNIGGVDNLFVDNQVVRESITIETTDKMVMQDEAYIGDSSDPSDTMIFWNRNTYDEWSNTGDDTLGFHAGNQAYSKARMIISPNQIIVNPYNEPYDFRVEGDTNDHLFFISGANEKIGILNSNPPKTLTVGGDISASGHLYLQSTKKAYLNSVEDTYLDSDSTDRIRFVAGGQQMLVLDYDTGNRAAFGDTKVGIGAGDNHLPNHELEVHGVISSSEYISTNSHIPASGNISASGVVTAEGLVISDDASITDDLTVGGNLDISDTIYHTGDSNTKIRFPEVDTITFHTSGNERLRIDASGNITGSGNLEIAGNVSGSSTSTGSFGHYQGDGSELTGVAATSLNIDAFGTDGTGDTVASDDKFIFSDSGTEKRGNISQIGTGLTSIINSSITKIGTATNEEYITFGTSNEVNTFIGNSEILSETATGIEVLVTQLFQEI